MSEILIKSAVHGIAPRSDALLQLGGDVERGRSSRADYDEQVAIETADWLNVQAKAGIDYAEDGKLRWQDHLRPIVKATAGFAPDVDEAPVTRWFDSNTFYRQPTITDDLTFNAAKFDEQVGPLGENVSLLAPDTFALLCANSFDGLPKERNVWRLYTDILAHFEDSGVKRVTFEDYGQGTKHDDVLDSLERHATWFTDLQLGLLKANVNEGYTAVPNDGDGNIGVTLGQEALQYFAEHVPSYLRPRLNRLELIRPVVDATTTSLEGVTALTLNELHHLNQLGASKLVLTHTVDLERLPLKYAQDKVKRLGEIARFTQEEVSVL